MFAIIAVLIKIVMPNRIDDDPAAPPYIIAV